MNSASASSVAPGVQRRQDRPDERDAQQADEIGQVAHASDSRVATRGRRLVVVTARAGRAGVRETRLAGERLLKTRRAAAHGEHRSVRLAGLCGHEVRPGARPGVACSSRVTVA